MGRYAILIVDDEANMRSGIRASLDSKKFHVDEAEDGEAAFGLFKKQRHAIVVTDLKMPKMDGMALLEKIKQLKPDTLVFMVSAFGDIEKAVNATKLGAYDFITKPFSCDEIELKINHAIRQLNLKCDIDRLQSGLSELFQMVGQSEKHQRLLEQLERVAPSDSRVLITGENGTGKELVARAIQGQGPRKGRPFVKVNCAAIPKDLVENELFGSEKGAYTGSSATRIGKFEEADKGTLFLDEIGDMGLDIQAKILRVLESGEITRVGGNRTIPVHVRVIAATNKNLAAEVKRGGFREDLFFRLNVIPVHVPALRERNGDIPILISHFLKEFNTPELKLDKESLDMLEQYRWPGNVRELKNVVERMLILHGPEGFIPENICLCLATDSDRSVASDRPIERQKKQDGDTLKSAREGFERGFVLSALERNRWNVSKTAEEIGLKRPYLYSKMQELGIKK